MATIKEVLQAYTNEYAISDTIIDKVILDNELTGSNTYTNDVYKEVEVCKAYLFKQLATNPSFRQGSYAITNTQANYLMSEANRIFKLYDITQEISKKTIIKNL